MENRTTTPSLLYGRVTEVDAEQGAVRVVFPSLQDLVSAWLPVIFAKTKNDQVIWMPDVDEHVVCLVDRHAESGVVLGAIYSLQTTPPVPSGDVAHVTFQDGSSIEYDRALHKLTIMLVPDDADIEITVTGNVTFNVPDGKQVILGGAGAKELATKDFVTGVYELHTHPTPAGLSSAPTPIAGSNAWPNITERAVGR